ncbi:ROK family protein [Pedobacter sp. SYSU D00535]|uniref:ROK family protein n=1 Tax=Pedobacter sp. SYSU D00535 TaxID=2810308 RepID=UPI001A962B90|nr:ROK family protein [Pedobacter sp. SYSU D00535]
MNNYILGININIPGIEVAVVDSGSKSIVEGTRVKRGIHPQETVENLLDCWIGAIKESLQLANITDSTPKIGLGMPGPVDYEKGISLMKNQNKFDALYGLNIKELIGERLGISPENIRMENVTPCFLQGEVFAGAAKGFTNIIGFTLNYGLGTALYSSGAAIDANLWNQPFKDGIAEDYLGIQWISRRYEEFTGLQVNDLKELTLMAKTDDGIGQLVFNEYGENFVKFLMEQVGKYDPDMVLIGGHNDAWELFIPHVKDRLSDKDIKVPIKQAVLGTAATLIGAANLWS